MLSNDHAAARGVDNVIAPGHFGGYFFFKVAESFPAVLFYNFRDGKSRFADDKLVHLDKLPPQLLG
ncbi:hypothetical protein ES703_123949 [subsurface metagenome]